MLFDRFVDTASHGCLLRNREIRTSDGLDSDVVLARFSAENKSLLRIPTDSFTR
jgi:hypothetical protein